MFIKEKYSQLLHKEIEILPIFQLHIFEGIFFCDFNHNNESLQIEFLSRYENLAIFH